MAPRPRPHKLTFTGETVVIWGDPLKVGVLFPAADLRDDVDPVEVTQNVKGHSRRQYPGDPTPVSRPGGERKVLKGGRKTYNATPGRAFTYEEATLVNGKRKMQASQFTLQGSYRVLRKYVLSISQAPADDVAPEFILRSPNGVGTPLDYKAAAAGASVAPAGTGTVAP